MRIFLLYLTFFTIFWTSCDNPITDEKDETPPKIVSVLLNQESPVSQIVEISCIVTDNVEVKELHLWLDGEHYNSMVDNAPPFRFDLNTTINDSEGNPVFLENVIYNISIKAVDISGNYSFSEEFISPISLSVDNSNSAPQIPQITSVQYSDGMNIINWIQNTEIDFKEYILKKRTILNSNNWITILQTDNQNITFFEDVDIDPFTPVEYYIIVFDEFDYYSTSSIVNSTMQGSPDPVNVTNISYSTEEMTVSWEISNAADFKSYTLYQWNENLPSQEYQIVATYNNKNIQSHALNFDENSGFSPIIENWFKVEVKDTFELSNFGLPLSNELDAPPLPVSIDTVIYNPYSMVVRWNITDENDVIGYQIIKDGVDEYAYINDFSIDYIYEESPDLSSPITFDIVTIDYWGQATPNLQGYEIINTAPVTPEILDIAFNPDSLTFIWSPIEEEDKIDFKNIKIYHSISLDFETAEIQFTITDTLKTTLTIPTNLYDFQYNHYFWIQRTDYWDKTSVSGVSHLFEYQGYSLPEPVYLYSPYFSPNNSFKLTWSISDNADFSHYSIFKADNLEMLNAEQIDVYGENDLLGHTQVESQFYDIGLNETNNYYQLVITDGYNMSAKSNIIRIWLDDFEWIVIQAGDYSFGTPLALDTLNINADYEILKYPVTNVQYIKYLRENLESFTIETIGDEMILKGLFSHEGEGFFTGIKEYFNFSNSQIIFDNNDFRINDGFENHPVTGISWFGSYQFAFDNNIRIPSDKEWEKSARGLSALNYPWSRENIVCEDGTIVCDIADCLSGGEPCSDAIAELNANFSNSGDPWESNFQATSPVGYFNGENSTINSPSIYGVYDMSGNVREWTVTSDSEGNYYLKGGAFSHGQNSNELKTWGHEELEPDDEYNNVGFRCVKD